MAAGNDPNEVLGEPNWISLGTCRSTGALTLGCGGNITLGFDNTLSESLEITVFEIGAMVDGYTVLVSSDGINFNDVGTSTGGDSTFSLVSGQTINFVRIVDGEECAGANPGADIDAVAIIGLD